ncbi:YmfQ family protein [Oleidesulfovibrio alaskensis]|jgi:uncharacterized protein YmfQ (DUF2313 family)|uniref:YmfQ family protein n=1 Tax=Oleidesulfovibrio alaskensis TaxID=58180 RepID=UPI001A5448E6|nr:putative phage tail protein [Oleidesulfovibrio alaskensis]MBL3582636.1 DUF2313 domain-containing protein [Oleidesulfovibrio alaskensis]
MKPYDQTQYAAQLKALLPPGSAFAAEKDSVTSALLTALAAELARLDAEAHRLLAEADPAQTLELLPEWEKQCGLPDACSRREATIAERRESVVMRLASMGGQSPDYYAELATAIAGKLCTVREYRPFRSGMSAAGDPLSNGDWVFTFAVQAPAVPIHSFACGQGAAGEPLRRWGITRLECVIRKLAPAHCIVIFTYGANSGG